jgi:hypothetical protein
MPIGLPRRAFAERRFEVVAPARDRPLLPRPSAYSPMPSRIAFRALALIVAALPLGMPAFATEPVKQIGAFVLPYYQAGATFADPPKVAVDPAWDKLLASTQPGDIRKARDGIAAKPDLVGPTTMMVLAIRLYDVGLRDDAVFWYYAARGRYATMDTVLDMRSLKLLREAETIDGFVNAVGPTINNYAFCDLARQQAQRDRAIQWVADHPYALLGSPDLPAQAEDRNASLGQAITKLHDTAVAEKAYLAKPENFAAMQAARAKIDATGLYCWK